MQFLIIAGGVSNRLKPVPDKNTLSLFGETLIERQVRILASIKGMQDGVIVCNPANITDIERLTENFRTKLNLRYILQDKPDGLEEAILCAADCLGQDSVLVVASNDVVEESAYGTFLKHVSSLTPDCALLASRVTEYFPGGYINVDRENNIKSIIEKPKLGSEPSDLVSIVVHWYRNGTLLLEQLREAKKVAGNRHVYDVMIERMVGEGKRCIAVPYDGSWQAVKYPWHVLDLMKIFFSDHAPKPFRSKRATISKTAVITGPVWIEDGVKILDGAVIKGPVYLGRNAVVGTNALVRESHIGNKSVVGFSTEVARSYVGANVWTHSNYIGDSVICDNVSLGAGTVTGNLRLDEEIITARVEESQIDTRRNKLGACIGPNVRIGINTSLMPGVRVGSGSFIGAGVLLSEDIGADQFVYTKQELQVKKNLKQIEERGTDLINTLLNE